MIENIRQATQINWVGVFVAILIALSTIKGIILLFEWFIQRLGIETKNMRERREARDLLNTTADLATSTAISLQTLQNTHIEDEQSIRNVLEKHMLDSDIDRAALHNEMKQYSDNRIKDRAQSMKIQKELNASIDKLTSMFLDHEISSMRGEILNFCAALSNGRKYNRESFDNIFRVYTRYEQILKDNEMENGLVEESIGYIREVYHNGLKDGSIR